MKKRILATFILTCPFFAISMYSQEEQKYFSFEENKHGSMEYTFVALEINGDTVDARYEKHTAGNGNKDYTSVTKHGIIQGYEIIFDSTENTEASAANNEIWMYKHDELLIGDCILVREANTGIKMT